MIASIRTVLASSLVAIYNIHTRIIPIVFLSAFNLNAQDEVVFSRTHGEGYFPMVVSVLDAKSSKPIAGAKVQIQLDPRLMPSSESEPYPSYRKAFSEPRITGPAGLAVLQYAARFTDLRGNGTNGHIRYFRGIISINAKGFKPTKIDLDKWVKENGYSKSFSAALIVRVNLEKNR